MAAARPWTDDDDARLRELHAAETSLRAIAAALDRSKTAVARRLAHHGLSAADRSQTMAATAAKVADARARRAALELALLEDAARLRQQLFAPTVAFNFGGKDNTYAEKRLDQPTFADQLKIVQATGAAIDRALRIAEHDADTGVDQAVGMLDQIAAAIGAAAAQIGDPDQQAP